ncbi:MAG: DMT family transporter [Tistlia sp.]|uniref:DMT family transporter n=1 Tax=Tistlia sp. TaxID=3057121 RepID=UPI0034A1A84A
MSQELPPRRAAPPPTGGEWGLIALLAALWASSFPLAEVALWSLPPLTVVLGRVALGAGALALLVRLRRLPWPRQPRVLGALLVMGLLNNVLPFSLIVWGQQHIDSGLASILNATTPLFAVLLAQVLTRDEKLTASRLTGVLCGLAGVALIVGPGALAGVAGGGAGGGAGAGLLGELAVLAAALCYALAGIWGRRFRQLPPLVTACGMLSASTLVMLPLALALERPWLLRPSAESLAAVAAVALVGTAAAYLLYFRILRSAGATNLLLVTLLIPAGALSVGAGLLDEPLEPRALVGLAAILVGLAVIDGRPRRWLAVRTGGRLRRGAGPPLP